MNNQLYAPIMIPTLCRFEHFKRCVESLSRCSLADQTELFIGLDYPPSDKYRPGYEAICEFIPSITGFEKVTVIKRDKNYGAVENINDLARIVLSKYDRYIFTEDDNEFAPNFLEYINWGLETFRDDKTVFAICGCKDIKTDDIANNVYKLNTIFNAWGFGCWADRYEKKKKVQNREVLGDIIKKASIFDAFTKKVLRLSSLTFQYAMHTIHGDVLVSLIPENEKWCIFPKINKVRNWGWDGTGLHGGSSESFAQYSSLPIDPDIHFVPQVVEDLYNPIIYERFKKKYKHSRKEYVRAAILFLSYKLTGYIPVSNKQSKWLKVKLLKVQ